MGELEWVRRNDPVARARARQEVIHPAAAKAITGINVAANEEIIRGTERIMQRTNAIADDAVFREVVPHSQDLINNHAEGIKGLAKDATAEIRRRASGV